MFAVKAKIYRVLFNQSSFIYCTARQCSPIRQKFIECTTINPALSLLMKHLITGQRQKAHNFSAFPWSPDSPHSCLISIGQHFVTTRVVHLPKRTETGLITESDQSGPNYRSDRAMRAVRSCNSWLGNKSL